MIKIIQLIWAPTFREKTAEFGGGFFGSETLYGLGDDGNVYCPIQVISTNEKPSIEWEIRIPNKINQIEPGS